MRLVSLSYRHVLPFVSQEEIALFEQEVSLHREHIYQRTGQGSDYLGWIDLPDNIDEPLLQRLEADARRIREQSEVVVVVGIGGSYLGSRAVIEALTGNFPGVGSGPGQGSPQMVYAGHHLDETYLNELLSWLDGKDYSIVVISKSGTTTEPAIAFRLLRKHMEHRFGKEALSRRIFAITDASRGALKQLADQQGFATYEIPDDVGGRFSVLTPVGLLPIAIAGFDVRKFIEGAREMALELRKADALKENPAALYAVIRNILYQKGMSTEILASYKPPLSGMIEWWKQLFGESEGKDGKGIFPAGVVFTTDLHSMGQFIQEGRRNLFETVLSVGSSSGKVIIPEEEEDGDGLNYLSGMDLAHVDHMAARGTMLAHVDGGVPNIEISIQQLDEANLGQLIYFFEMACAISGYILGVNPFDQPGVEAYKRNMFALLGKPGFEEEGKALRKRL